MWMVQRCLNFRSKKSWHIDPITKTKRVTTHYLSPNKTWHANRQNIYIIHTHPITHTDSLTPLTKKTISLSLSLSLSLNMAEEKQKHSGGGGAGGGIVAVDPKPNNGLTSKVIDFVEKLIVKLMYDSSLPHHYLSGNFAPVREETPPTTDLLVKGHLPVRTIILFFFFLFCTV